MILIICVTEILPSFFRQLYTMRVTWTMASHCLGHNRKRVTLQEWYAVLFLCSTYSSSMWSQRFLIQMSVWSIIYQFSLYATVPKVLEQIIKFLGLIPIPAASHLSAVLTVKDCGPDESIRSRSSSAKGRDFFNTQGAPAALAGSSSHWKWVKLTTGFAAHQLYRESNYRTPLGLLMGGEDHQWGPEACV